MTDDHDVPMQDRDSETFNDPETELLEILSGVAQYENLSLDENVSSFLWSCLTSTMPLQENPTNNRWVTVVQRIQVLLTKMSPFDIHHVAMQAALFCENESRTTFSCLLLLLCVYALRQQKEYGNKRFKRWRSLLCETVRLYQREMLLMEEDSEEEEENFSYTARKNKMAVGLWINHVFPACAALYETLPAEQINRVPLLAGMVGTSTRVLSQYCIIHQQQPQLQNIVALFYNSVGAVIGYRYDQVLWCHPWRCHASVSQSSNADMDLMMHETDLAWWTQCANHHESVAGMDTSWDPVGVALLAAYGFDASRPLVWANTYVWWLWFPHVEILLGSSSVQLVGLGLLDKLSTMIPRHVLTYKKAVPDSPIGTFQLLSSYIMAHAASKQRQLQQGQPTVQTVSSQMKLLLSKYIPCSQVDIVKELVDKCPHPGFVPRLLDMLRPLVSMQNDKACQEMLWEYLATIVEELYNLCASGLRDTDKLMEKLEVYVSAITMVQMRLMAKNDSECSIPIQSICQQLHSIHQALEHALEKWSRSDTTTTPPPPEHYRLYLLQDALHQVVRISTPTTKRKIEETDCALMETA